MTETELRRLMRDLYTLKYAGRNVYVHDDDCVVKLEALAEQSIAGLTKLWIRVAQLEAVAESRETA